ncbi:MAG: hypothetical protein ABIJ61_03100, partial [bacterium]
MRALAVIVATAALLTGSGVAEVQDLQPLGEWPIFWGYPQDIAVQEVNGSVYLYATLNESTTPLIQIDATDPNNPTLLRELPMQKWCVNTTLVGDYLYTGSTGGFIYIFDVSDPLDVDTLTIFNNGTSDRIRAVTIVEPDINTRYAYFNSQAKFEIWDFSDLFAPSFLGRTTEGDSVFHAWRIVLDDDLHYAYMVCRPSLKLNIYDVSTPTAPTLLFSSHDSLEVLNVVLSADGHRAFVSTVSGLLVYDVSDPATPLLEQSFIPYENDIDPWNRDGRYEGIALSPDETKLYLAGKGGFQPHLIKEAHDPDESLPSGHEIYSYSEYYESGQVATGHYDDDGLLMRGGLQVLDISDLEAIEVLGTWVDEAEAIALVDVTVSGSQAYVADNIYGLRIFDISNPALPAQLGGFHYCGEVDDIYWRDDLAFAVTNLGGGISIVDISDPATPTLLSYYHTGQELWDFAGYVGDYIYAGRGRDGFTWGLDVVDISDPTTPTAVTKLPVKYIGHSIPEGNLIYGMTGEIFNVSEPSHPRIIGSVHLEGGTVTSRAEGLGALKVGPYLYFLNAEWEPNPDWQAFMVADVSDPRRFSPRVIGGCATLSGEFGAGKWSQSAAVDRRTVYDSVYVALGIDGIGVVDVSDPTSPTLAHCITADINGYQLGGVCNLAINGDYLFVHTYSPNKPEAVFDISDGIDQLVLLDTFYVDECSWTARIGEDLGIVALLDGLKLFEAPGWLDFDTEPPTPVAGLTATTQFDRVALSWDLPIDDDWLAVKVMRSPD